MQRHTNALLLAAVALFGSAPGLGVGAYRRLTASGPEVTNVVGGLITKRRNADCTAVAGNNINSLYVLAPDATVAINDILISPAAIYGIADYHSTLGMCRLPTDVEPN